VMEKFGEWGDEYESPLLSGIKDEFRAVSDYKIQPVYGRMEPNLPLDHVIGEIEKMKNERVDGLILEPNAFDYMSQAVQLNRMGIPLVTMVGDIPNSELRLSYVANNGHIDGRLGAELLDMMCGGGEYAIVTGNAQDYWQYMIVKSFQGYMLGKNSDVRISVIATNRDEKTCYELTDKLIRETPGLKGIFACSWPYKSLCRLIAERGLQDRIAVIGVDFDDEIASFVDAGIIRSTIVQNPYLLGRIAVRTMCDYLTSGKIPQKEILINPQPLFKSTVYSYKSGMVNW